MLAKKTLAILSLSVATAIPSAAFAAAPDVSTRCILQEHRIVGVQALHSALRNSHGVSERLIGARVFVQAEPALTAEWLQLTMQRHITQTGTRGMNNCPLDAKGVRVTVQSAGTGFAISIAGDDAAQAKEILRRAQLLAK